MKKLFVLIGCLSIGLSSFAGQYHLNENAIEDAFAQSNDVTLTCFSSAAKPNAWIEEFELSQAIEEGSKQKVAAIVGIASLITGIGILIPIHRFILGTGGKGAIIFLVYCAAGIIGGWSWWLTAIDVVFIFMDDTKSKYIGSNKIIMWMDSI